MTNHPTSESRWGGPKVALGAILALAATLRLVGIEYGLPYGNVLNPDEATIVPRAWAMTHGEGADPHPFFDYPSLLLYLLAPFESWQDAPDYLAARLVAVAIALIGVAAAWWLGARAYGTIAGAIAAAATAVATTHVAYSRVAVTDVLLTTLVTIALALLVSRRIELAGLAVGLAASAKYPGLIAFVPIVIVAWRRWQRLAGAAALCICGFVAASPFALVHAGEMLSDLNRTQDRVRAGWLGFENDHASPIAFVDRLWESLGPLLVVAVIGVVAAAVRRSPVDRALVVFALVYYATLLPLDAHFDRYVLPLVPVLGALAGSVRSVAPVTLLLLVVPLTWTVRDDRELIKTDTRVVAAGRYSELGGRLAVDPSLPVAANALLLPLPAPWTDEDAEVRDLDRLRQLGVKHLVLTGAVEDSVLAARDDYPRESAFYDEVQVFPRVFRIDPEGDLGGPWVAVFRLTSEP